MKVHTIEKVINSKFNEFLSSINDDEVRTLVSANTIITGGCIASMLLKEDVNDFDLYFTNKQTVLAVAKYYVETFNSENSATGVVMDGDNLPGVHKNDFAYSNMTPDRVKIFFVSKGVVGTEEPENNDEGEPVHSKTDKRYFPVFLSSNAITLSNKIQIVIRFYGEAKDIHDNYDYIHCTNFWTSKDRKLTLNQPALESILGRELKYIGSKYPVASVIRTRKFIKRGWTINAGQYLKMAFQISKLDLSDPVVLEDQLVGVDAAYFSMLIEGLESKKTSDPNFILTYSYLAEIIDRIFH